jgi:hypothetical protein
MRASIALILAALLTTSAMAGGKVQVFKSDSCQCCNKWVAHMQSRGFTLETKDISNSDRTRLRATLGIKPEHAACHTAIVGDYIIEGHVPAEDVERLLSEKPDARGLTVVGMPAGSPGMEMEDGTKEPFEVLLMKKDGTTEVFARH